MTAITARQVFAPLDSGVDSPTGTWVPRRRHLPPPHPREVLRALTTFYRDPLSWFGALGTLLIIAYGGGAVLFILHANVLGELGPAISPTEHWALDSTLGFVGFAPVVAVLVPLTAWIVTPQSGAAMRPRRYALVAGVLMGLAAAPGPIAHDLLVGRGTWLADRVTAVVGSPAGHAAHAHGDSVPQWVSIGSQVAVGIPAYMVLMWVSLVTVRYAVRWHAAARQDAARLAATLADPAAVLIEPASTVARTRAE